MGAEKYRELADIIECVLECFTYSSIVLDSVFGNSLRTVVIHEWGAGVGLLRESFVRFRAALRRRRLLGRFTAWFCAVISLAL